jgi:sugar/nucleoside kinase (ribokinase family)
LVTATRLGWRCAFAGLLGIDELSTVIEENFLHEGVEVSFAPRTKDAPVPHSVIIVGTETGSRNIFCDTQRMRSCGYRRRWAESDSARWPARDTNEKSG